MKMTARPRRGLGRGGGRGLGRASNRKTGGGRGGRGSCSGTRKYNGTGPHR